MSSKVNLELLASMIKAKRGEKGLRAAAGELEGVSASTLSRIEQGKIPDLETFVNICKWLEVPTDTFTGGSLQTTMSSKSSVVAQLRADKGLEPETVKMLISMIDMAYDKGKRKLS